LFLLLVSVCLINDPVAGFIFQFAICLLLKRGSNDVSLWRERPSFSASVTVRVRCLSQGPLARPTRTRALQTHKRR